MSNYNHSITFTTLKDNPRVPGLRAYAPPSPVTIRHLRPDGTIGPIERTIPEPSIRRMKRNKNGTTAYVN